MSKSEPKKRWSGPREKCDLCGMDITDAYFVDGRTRTGQWALMCLPCHELHGSGLGPGQGQEYNVAGEKVAG